MEIRKAEMKDLAVIMEMYEQARVFMAAHGNPNQWGKTNPTRERIEKDIREGGCRICEENRCPAAVFYFCIGEDPTYRVIEDGSWLNDRPYGVVHRITSNRTVKGAAAFCLQWALSQCGNLRIDTHRDNIVMQNLLGKLGFTLCGRIYIADGSERLAYQKSL